jgi:hypothetical protein
MKRLFFTSCALALALFSTTPASGSPVVVFDNYPINGNLTSLGVVYTSFGHYDVSDSFVADGSTLTGVNVGLVMQSDEVPVTIDWAIGTTPFGTDVGSGIGATLTNTLFLASNVDGNVVYSSNFSLPNLAPAAGTYYLTIINVSTNIPGGLVWWDVNSGAGIDAWDNFPGGPVDLSAGTNCSDNTPAAGSCASAFQILGTTPEPASVALLGSGLLATALLRRRAVRR